jgi:hypothetical protein
MMSKRKACEFFEWQLCQKNIITLLFILDRIDRFILQNIFLDIILDTLKSKL